MTSITAQKELYHFNDNASSIFNPNFESGIPYQLFDDIIIGSFTNKNDNTWSVEYDLWSSREPHFILSTTLIQDIPPVYVNKNYVDTVEIAWCPKIAINLLKDYNFTVNDNSPIFADSFASEIHSRYKTKVNDSHIGNIPELTEWNTYLIPYKTSYKIPIAYSENSSIALPLYKRSKDIKFKQIHTYSNKCIRFLKMRTREKIIEESGNIIYDKWIERTPTPEYININTPTFPHPILKGTFAICDKEYIKVLNCHNSKLYYHHMVSIDSGNPEILGKNLTFKLTEESVKAIFLGAQQVNIDKDNDIIEETFSNFTTHTNYKEGYTPIEHIILPGVIDCSTSELVSKKNHFYIFPKDKIDIIAIPLGDNPYMSYNVEMGCDFLMKNSTLAVHLKDTNPYKILLAVDKRSVIAAHIDVNHIKEKFKSKLFEPNKDYIIKIRLLTTRKIEFIGDNCTISE